ncbi:MULTISPECIES: hypothetical protein [Chloracidobacterium]|nr:MULTISPECIES: hypothetical protein [Chloracidobacterium]
MKLRRHDPRASGKSSGKPPLIVGRYSPRVKPWLEVADPNGH